MTDRIISHLQARLLEIRAGERGCPLPLLCYALSEGVLPEEEVRCMADVDLSDRAFLEKHEDCALALAVLWIRRYYELANGLDYWQCLSPDVCRESYHWRAYLRRHAQDIVGRPPQDTLFPTDRNDNDFQPWVRSECWVLKADERGQTSEIHTFNEKVCSFLDRCFEDESERILDLALTTPADLSTRLELLDLNDAFPDTQVPGHLGKIWGENPLLLVLSLYAQAESPQSALKEKALSLHPWLAPMWGKARDIRGRGVSANWYLFDNGYCEACLLCSIGSSFEDNEVKLKQGRHSLPLPAGGEFRLSICELERQGFNAHQPMFLSAGRHPVPPLHDGLLVFLEQNSRFHPLLTSEPVLLPRSRDKRIHILAPCMPDSVILGGKACRMEDEDTELVYTGGGRTMDYLIYRLPDTEDLPTAKLPLEVSVLQENRVRAYFSKRPGIQILNREDSLKVENLPGVVVAKGAEPRVSATHARGLAGQRTGITYRVVDRDTCAVEGVPPGTMKALTYRDRNNKDHRMSVLLLPDDWKLHATLQQDQAYYRDILERGEKTYHYTLANGMGIRLKERLAEPYAVWSRGIGRKMEFTDSTLKDFQSLIKEGYVLHTFSVKGKCKDLEYKTYRRGNGTLPLGQGRTRGKTLCELLDGAGLGWGECIILSFGGREIFHGPVRLPKKTPQKTKEPAQQQAEDIKEMLDTLDALPRDGGRHPVPDDIDVPKLPSALVPIFKESLKRAYGPQPQNGKLTGGPALLNKMSGNFEGKARQLFMLSCVLQITKRNWKGVANANRKCPAYLSNTSPKAPTCIGDACISYLDEAPPDSLRTLRDFMDQVESILNKH